MDIPELLSSIDSEIAKLQQVRALLAGQDNVSTVRATHGRRTRSAEVRAKMAAAQKARWAKAKRVAKKGA